MNQHHAPSSPYPDAHFVDSQVFGHLWSTEHSRETFSERNRIARWVRVITALARSQAALGVIPQRSGDAIQALAEIDLDIARVAERTRATGHSTLGLIQVLQESLPEFAREHVYYGTTVQDITDTALCLEVQSIGSAVWDDLRQIEYVLIGLAGEHRTTPMLGRTHGQPGAPITFGYKVASWLDEIGRSIVRLGEARQRVLVVQLAGAVGTLGFFGVDGLALRSRFATELGLAEPAISWLTARDRLAEFAAVLSITTATLARISNEVYSLQRRELGEVSEATTATTVGSITMPHKRNPEFSEQVVALARMVRTQAGLLTETMVQEHERDARGWKVEWVAFPELCHYATAATHLSLRLVEGIEVHVDVMAANLHAAGFSGSEQILRQLAPLLGKHRAQGILHDAYRQAQSTGKSVADVLAGIPAIQHAGIDLAGTETSFNLADVIDVGAAAEMTDRVLDAARQRRASEPATWV